jgi:RNA polymerase sigma factor (sigma-70 family)
MPKNSVLSPVKAEARESRRVEHLANSQALSDLLTGKSGEARAVYEEIFDALRSALLVTYGTQIDVDDVVGQAVYKALRHMQNPKKDITLIENFRGWLFQIAHNQARDKIRKANCKHEASYTTDRYEADEPACESGLVEAILDDERRLLLQRVCLDVLSDEEREVVKYKAEKGMTSAGIAKLTGTPEGTVKTRMRSAITKLRGVFEGYMSENPAAAEQAEKERRQKQFRIAAFSTRCIFFSPCSGS